MCVFVADRMPRRPPVTGVGMAGFGDEDRAEAPDVLGIVPRVKLQFIHPLKVEGEAAIAAVDLEAVAILAAGGEAGGLEGADRAVGKPHVHQGCVFHGHSSAGRGIGARARREGRRSGARQRPFVDEAGGQA